MTYILLHYWRIYVFQNDDQDKNQTNIKWKNPSTTKPPPKKKKKKKKY